MANNGCLSMEEPRFVVDLNVGRSATWLRVMGYDTLFPLGAEDNELVRIALRDGRIIVTKDTGLTKRHVVTTGRLKVELVKPDDLESQLRQVFRSLDLDSQRKFSRCVRCNELLVELSREKAKGRVPPYVYETQKEFRECTLCRRIYWRGTHWANMRRELERIRGGER